jgi:tRNA dimethylallyltransferase
MSAIILIAGPTASGKSALALELAEKLGGVIINADSMQVYRDLRIITARPSPDEERRLPHRLYGHVAASENYSVGRWFAEATKALSETREQGRPALLVGGTGLYFSTLTRGIAAVPPIPEELRREVRARLTAEGTAALHAELAARDPATAARLKPGDRSRITRALEVVLATGRSLTVWHDDNTRPSVDIQRTAKVFLMPERDELRSRIDARFDAMMAAGALAEVRALAARNLDPNLPAMKAHGVPWLIRHLNGEIPLDEAVAQAKRDTQRYTKRQATWFRNQLPQFEWVEPTNAAAAVERQMPALSKASTN